MHQHRKIESRALLRLHTIDSKGDKNNMVSEAPARQTAESLELLDNTQSLLRTIFLGLALQYKAMDLQRCRLLQEPEDPVQETLDPIAVQTAASLITLCALFGFQRQAEHLACQTAMAGEAPDMTDVKLGATVILISLIRLVRLQNQPGLETSLEDAEL